MEPEASAPSVDALQEQLEKTLAELASRFGLATAVQVLGQVMAKAPAIAAAAEAGAKGPGTAERTPVGQRISAGGQSSPEDRHTNPRVHVKTHPVHLAADGRHHVITGMWKRAVALAQKASDPWASRGLHRLAMEHCIRHRYRAEKHAWVTDDVLVKIEHKPFAAGAMRECFAMKKISTFSQKLTHDWHKAQNCVAKRYKKEGVGSEVYFWDVTLQMDAKQMGEDYNKTDPPKQVDIMQAAIIEFPDRPGKPIMSFEQFMTGDYVKYNSNSGFVMVNDILRYTPQAFSHFTWSHSKGQRICVDIQGVGDLYTDPQIHTLDGEMYGDGNLGLRGIAYFFRSHQCNPLCARLNLKPFTRCPADVKAQGYTSDSDTKGSSMSRNQDRTFVRRSSSLMKRLHSMQRRANAPPQPISEEEMLGILSHFPKDESHESLVHLEVSRIYAEVVMLPELRPEESPEDALKGGLFHLYEAAKMGSVLAVTTLARMYTGIEPSTTSFAHLYKVAHKQGEVVHNRQVAWRCALVAAERGVGGAALAVAHGKALEVAAELGALIATHESSQPSDGAWVPAALRGASDFPQRMGVRDNTILEETEDDDMSTSSMPTSPSRGITGDMTRSQSGVSSVSDRTDTSLETVGVVTAQLSLRKIPSLAFVLRKRLAYEDEASGLPHAAIHDYEVHGALGKLLLAQAEANDGDGAQEAAEHLNQAAELASTAGKGKLAQQFFELAAQAESY